MDKNGFSDIEKLKLYLDGCHIYHNEISKLTPFSNVETVYKWTNEKFETYPKENLDEKKY